MFMATISLFCRRCDDPCWKARPAATPAQFAQTLSGRLHSLAAAHALVLKSGDNAHGTTQLCSATLCGLTDAIFQPYETTIGERFVVIGRDVELGDRATTSLALVFHELATNAMTYGALSADEGLVSVKWEPCDGNLVLRWQENGGPTIVGSPGQQGFGSTLLRNTITRQFGGTLRQDWREQGLRLEFILPLTKLAN